ncbi:hypothetical protein OKW23_000292 [Bacilli bacterium PM5-9]|nr:hypothetical protein [Bacilli bacterium PM5-9]
MQSKINLNDINTDDKDIIDLISTLKSSPKFEVPFLRNGRIYLHPVLYMRLDKRERSKLDITDYCGFYPIITEIVEKQDEYILTGFTFIENLSFFSKGSINYSGDNELIKKIEIIEKPEFKYDTNGISTMYYSGIEITLNKKSIIESKIDHIFLNIEYEGIKKRGYLCSYRDGELTLSFKQLSLDLSGNIHKIIKFKNTNLKSYESLNYLKLYKGVPNVYIIDKVKAFNNIIFSRKYKLKNKAKRKPGAIYNFLSVFFNTYKIIYISINGEVIRAPYSSFLDTCNGNEKKNLRMIGQYIYYQINKDQKFLNKIWKKFIESDLYKKYILKTKSNVIIDPKSETDYQRIKDIEKIEKRYNLLEKSINSIKFWQIGRFFIVNHILQLVAERADMFKAKKDIIKENPMSVAESAWKYMDFKNSPLYKSKNIDNMVFDNLRKIFVDNKNIDVNSYYFIDEKLDENKTIVCEYPFWIDHISDKTDNMRYLDGYLIFTNAFCRMEKVKVFLSNNDKEYLEELSKDIFNDIGVEYNTKRRAKYWIRRALFEMTYYFCLFNEISPNNVYIVGPYKQWIYECAKFFGINTIEFQYAAIETGHLGYSFNKSKELKPDKMVIWSDFWKKELDRYNTFEYIEYPNKFFYENLKIESNKEPDFDVAFLSQNAIGIDILKIAYNFAKNNPSIKVLYRWHPHENESIYSIFKECENLDNMFFVSLKEESIYDTIKNAKVLVGVYSTSVIEGYAVGKQVILLNLEGIEYMRFFTEQFDTPIVDDEVELLDAYNNVKDKDNKLDKTIF